ncbi:hypothetical protein MRX96_056626 [Rhipicephalus microplus]
MKSETVSGVIIIIGRRADQDNCGALKAVAFRTRAHGPAGDDLVVRQGRRLLRHVTVAAVCRGHLPSNTAIVSPRGTYVRLRQSTDSDITGASSQHHLDIPT